MEVNIWCHYIGPKRYSQMYHINSLLILFSLYNLQVQNKPLQCLKSVNKSGRKLGRKSGNVFTHAHFKSPSKAPQFYTSKETRILFNFIHPLRRQVDPPIAAGLKNTETSE